MTLSERIRNVSPSETLSITAQVIKMKSEGKNIISFGAGEPDFDTPKNIQEEAIKAIKEGFTHYTSLTGITELKRAIIEKMKKDHNLFYNEKEIIISNGAKHSLYNAIMTICDPGDEVILPTPCWVSYTEQIKLAQAKPVFVPTTLEDGFKLTAEQVKKAITKKTKLLLLNTPNNPTGAVYSPIELNKIASLLVDNDIYCISDEIYEKLVYDNTKHYSIAAFSPEVKEKTILINGVSKSYAMTGWRIGYAAANAEIVEGMSKLQGHCTSNANSIAQKASVEALTGNQDSIEFMRTEFDKRRKVITEKINEIKGFKCAIPEGAFYIFPDITEILKSGIVFEGEEVKSSLQLSNYILKETGVAVIPGSAFEAEGFLRLSYAISLKEIIEGIDRIKSIFN